MKCKYKKFSNERLCQVINGECQFLLCKYGPECPIYQNYKDWDKAWTENQAATNGGVAEIDEIMAADVYDEGAGPFVCDVLDLDFD